MSTIKKLLIRGIRSFDIGSDRDGRHGETIAFETPLTLIVGSNGSGKTTVIEALKYATTGDKPPNSRGGAFIHDPALVGEKEVRAQVKLSFQSTGGANMVLTRSLVLMVKKTTRQEKTLDCNLLMVREGERTNITSRVAELDQIMPHYLGVSKAILESVIFCHQDESLWPMSEPAALKKRFDEIFEAQKYTKAIDNIKQLRKTQNENLKLFKEKESHSKENKDRADRAKKRMTELTEQLDELRADMDEVKEKAKEAESKAQTARDHAAKYTEVIEKLKALRTHRDWYEQQLQTLKINLQERSESDEWLQSELSQYEERLALHQKREDEQTERYKLIEKEISSFRQRQSEKRVEHGKYEQQKVTQEKRIQERDAEIKNCASKNNLRGYEMELDDMQISEFMEKITTLSKAQTSKLEQLRTESRTEQRSIQRNLDELREGRTTMQESRKAAKEQLSRNEQKIASFYSQLEKFTVDEGGKATLETKIEELNSKLEALKRHLTENNSDNKIREGRREISRLEDETKALNQEFIQSSNKATELVKLDHLKKESKERQKNLETIKGAQDARLKQLVHADWQPGKLDAEFQRVIEEKKNNVERERGQRDSEARDLAQLQFKLKTAGEDVKAKETEMEDCVRIIRKAIGKRPEEYPEELATAQETYEASQASVDGFKPMQEFFIGAIAKAQSSKPTCRLCLQKLPDNKTVENFVGRLQAQFSADNLEKLQKALKEDKEDLEMVKEASSSYDTWKRLSEKELPSLRSSFAILEQKCKAAIEKVESLDQAVAERAEEQREVELLTKPVANITKCFDDLERLREQVNSLENESQAAGLTHSLEDIKDQLEQVAEQQKSAKAKLSRLENEDKQTRDQINALLLELERAKNKLTTANYELQEQVSIGNQVSDLKKANQSQRETMARIAENLDELVPKIDEQQKKLEDSHQRGAEKERLLQRAASQLSDDVRNLQRANQEIQAYIQGGGSANLTRCQREISSLDSQIASSQAESRQLTIEINKIRDDLKYQDHNKRVITDNLNYRKMQREFQSNADEINRLASQNAEVDQEHHKKEAAHWEHVYNMAARDRAHKIASANAKDESLQQLIADWNTDYKDAAQIYRKAHIEVETTKAAVEDLGRYGGALDKAIMKYHSLKMEQINRSIEELWKATYQGTDVDTILIRSDNETGKGNRSYNYRVCMVKQDAEMDMRGRCSAGQRVLASIIIRLALAECFGEYCGLIALDEPTTNLDRDNIKSLAESLHGIIRQRQAQRNFQLIVITHDEEFLRYMKCADFCDYYYRIYRDGRQKSVIERQRIGDVL
ncbi:MAG: hypothetical protein LQ340_002254 [Diploschistes diacapsis]|nr:MAG: hypothetical protein LQ340_002254 [Diploschistes diacapsis]